MPHTKRSTPSNSSLAILLFIAVAVMWIPWLGDALFYSKGEPREAIVSVAMLQSGDWILPVAGGEIPYKPPMLAWLISILALFFNGGVVNEFIARMPSAIAATAMVMATFFWAKRHHSHKFAFATALVLATSFEVFRAAEACRVDMVLTACMVGAIFMLQRLIDDDATPHRWWRRIAIVLLLSGATLTKGPIGAALPLLAVAIYALIMRPNKWLNLGKLTLYGISALIIPAIWYYAAYLHAGPQFLDLVWEENFGRLTGTMSYDSHINPFYYNFITILSGMAPWTLLVVLTAHIGWKHRSRPAAGAAMAITAALTIIIFYCIPASKRSVYLLPAYPFMAYGVATLISLAGDSAPMRAFNRIVAVLAVIAPVAIIASAIIPFGKFSFSADHWWRWCILLIPAMCGFAALLTRDGVKSAASAFACIWAIFLCYNAAVMPAAVNPLSSKPQAETIRREAAGRPIYTLGEIATHPTYSLVYYLDNQMQVTDKAHLNDLATGSVVIITDAADTVAVADTAAFAVRQLTPRLADTRHPAYLAIRR